MYKKDRTWVEIDLNNITHNYNEFKKYVESNNSKTKTMAVIKANAYGHGDVEVAKALEKINCDYFAVATFYEAKNLVDAKITTPILILNHIDESHILFCIENDLTLTIYTKEYAKIVNEYANKVNKKIKAHLKIDTGMSRIGIKYNDNINKFIKILSYENIIYEGVFSHFALADDINSSFTDEQCERFVNVINSLNNVGINFDIRHICNTAGTMRFPNMHFEMVRVGIGLYGYYPSTDMPKMLDIRTALKLKTRIIHKNNIEKNVGVSYGHYYISDDRRDIAVIPIGYADGLTRLLSGEINVDVNGYNAPLIGRICMDQSMIDVTNIQCNIGDVVTVYNGREAVEHTAQVIGTINYEVLCMIGERVQRYYV